MTKAAHGQAAPTDTALVAAWLASLPSPNTRDAYRHDLELFVTWRAASGSSRPATTADIQRFRAHCERAGSGASTVNRRLAALSSFYRYAVDQRGGTNPVEGAPRPATASKSSTAHLDDVDADAIWRAAVELGDKTATVVGLVLLDGLKSNELLTIDVEDVAVRGRDVSIRLQLRDEPHVVQLHPLTAAVVRRHVGDRDTGPLLLGDNPTRARARLTRFGVDYLVKRAGALAGLTTPLTVNALRRRQIVAAHTESTPIRTAVPAVRLPARSRSVDPRTVRRYLPE